MASAMMPDTGVSTPRRCAFLALTSVPRRGRGVLTSFLAFQIWQRGRSGHVELWFLLFLFAFKY